MGLQVNVTVEVDQSQNMISWFWQELCLVRQSRLAARCPGIEPWTPFHRPPHPYPWVCGEGRKGVSSPRLAACTLAQQNTLYSSRGEGHLELVCGSTQYVLGSVLRLAAINTETSCGPHGWDLSGD
jgi:hypothetical protein